MSKVYGTHCPRAIGRVQLENTHTHTRTHTHTLTHANTPRPVRVAEVWWLDKTEGLRDVKILVLGPYNMHWQTFTKK